MITVNREQFDEAAKSVASIAKKGAISPAAEAAFLSSSEDGVFSIKGTDMANWLSLSIPGDGGSIEPIQVDAFKLADIVSKLTGETVKIEAKDGYLHLASNKSKRKIAGMATTYPVSPPVEGITSTINVADLRAAIDFAKPIVDVQHNMPMIRGVRLADDHAIGTNGGGFCAARCDGVGEPITLTIDTIKLLKSVTSSDEAELTHDGRRVSIRWDGGEIASSLIEGDWGFLRAGGVSGFIKDHDAHLTCHPAELMRAVTAVNALAASDSATRTSRVALSLSREGCAVVPKSSVGEGEEPFDAEWDGEDMTINILHNNLDRAFKGFDANADVVIGITALPESGNEGAKGCTIRQPSQAGLVAMVSQVR